MAFIFHTFWVQSVPNKLPFILVLSTLTDMAIFPTTDIAFSNLLQNMQPENNRETNELKDLQNTIQILGQLSWKARLQIEFSLICNKLAMFRVDSLGFHVRKFKQQIRKKFRQNLESGSGRPILIRMEKLQLHLFMYPQR